MPEILIPANHRKLGILILRDAASARTDYFVGGRLIGVIPDSMWVDCTSKNLSSELINTLQDIVEKAEAIRAMMELSRKP